jgi:hypothetical protein
LEYEHDLIKQALIQSDGKEVTLRKMIETKHPDLIPARTQYAAVHRAKTEGENIARSLSLIGF